MYVCMYIEFFVNVVIIMEYRVLELFSGIGGMHLAFEDAGLKGEIVAAIDINPVANAVYAANYANTPVWNNNIEKLKAQKLEQLNINMLLMSPPCQPHTRVGNRLDVNDPRSDALQHITTLLSQCAQLQYVLMENVKGFENSQARDQFINALDASGFYWREFILSPHQLGVPNTRHRYYCLARRTKDFNFEGHQLWQQLPQPTGTVSNNSKIEDILVRDSLVPSDVYVPVKVLQKYVRVLDIVTKDSYNSICFTKAYTHYQEGTGSIYTSVSSSDVSRVFAQLKQIENDSSLDNESKLTQKLELLKELKLRYFTPREVARLMSFPETFKFPTHTTIRQQYRLLGNSINIKVVGTLIKLLCS